MNQDLGARGGGHGRKGLGASGEWQPAPATEARLLARGWASPGGAVLGAGRVALN